MSGCSPGADYPSIFPAVHDMPPPRADTPLDADQVQQATETLITERNQLSAAAQASGQNRQFIESRRRGCGEETARVPRHGGQPAPPPATARAGPLTAPAAGAETK